jgi:hypothetical protein
MSPKLGKGNKNILFSVFLAILCVSLLVMSLRGVPGNPNALELSQENWQKNGPFELSPERGRFALVYSLAENHSLRFSLPVARFVVPDLGISATGQYVSLFAPGVSYLVLPGYFLGKALGAAQVGTYAVIGLFAFFNMALIYLITKRLGASPPAAVLGGLVFLFATPAFAYAVNLYQHHISTCLLLAGVYILMRWRSWLALVPIWIFCGLSIAIDNPNFFLMLPIGFFALGRLLVLAKKETGQFTLNFNLWKSLTLLMLIPPLLLLVWFNQASHQDKFKLSGALPRVVAIDNDGYPTQSSLAQDLKLFERDLSENKSLVKFFETRNMLHGFYIHLMSPDRGVIYYAPVIFLGILGLMQLRRQHPDWVALLIAIAALNLLLYSMWGDPWGGWAFGSRYLIPAYALLAIGVGIALNYWRQFTGFLFLFFVLFVYSSGVNTLGALTTSANPPQAEVLNLEKISGHEEKYTYGRNWQYLNEYGSKSFVYQAIGKKYFSARGYYYLVLAGILVGGALPLFFLARGGLQIKDKRE